MTHRLRWGVLVGSLSLVGVLSAEAATLTRATTASGGPVAGPTVTSWTVIGDAVVGTATGPTIRCTIGFLTTPGPSDTTPPTTPVVRDDGQSTTVATQLHASWISTAAGGIAEYQYRITQDSIIGMVIVDWTSAGTATEVTRTGLELFSGKTYYVGVRARNPANYWSEVGYSDGITVALSASAPVLQPIGDKAVFVRSSQGSSQQQAVKAPPVSAAAQGTGPSQPAQESPGEQSLPFVPGEVIVRFKPYAFELPSGTRIASASELRMTAESLQALTIQFGLVSAERIFRADHRLVFEQRWGNLDDIYVLRFPPTVNVQAIVTAYRNDPQVVYAEPNYTVWIVPPEPGVRKRLLKPDR